MTRTAIITGGTRGIGKAISIMLAEGNFNLVLNFKKDLASAELTRDACMRYHKNVFLFKGDIANQHHVREMIDESVKRFSAIDVVINNAGLNIDKPLFDLSESDWDEVVDTNMKGTFLVSRESARIMMRQETGGHIINVSATTAIKGRKNGINYCASKAGVLTMTKCLALELGPRVRANCILPGFTLTDETYERFDLSRRLNEELNERKTPLRRMAQPVEIANAIKFLISDEAKFINGQKLIVDGGEYMY